jgi:hypothetical protein
MAVAFRKLTLDFDPTKGQEQVQTGTAVFSSTVNRAHAALNGFRAEYASGDHELKQLRIDIDDPVAISQNTVSATVRYLLRDASGTIDDPYSGRVDVLVIADVV